MARRRAGAAAPETANDPTAMEWRERWLRRYLDRAAGGTVDVATLATVEPPNPAAAAILDRIAASDPSAPVTERVALLDSELAAAGMLDAADAFLGSLTAARQRWEART